MHYADIKIGYDCNNNCIHCVIANQRVLARRRRGDENRSTKECCDEILDSRRNGYKAVVITGGEPTIRADFIDIVTYAKSLGMAVGLQTNGRKFSDRAFAEKAVPALDYITVAIHGSTAEVHETITRAAGSFRETMDGLGNITRLTKNVCGKTVISNYNRDDLVNILGVLRGFGISRSNIAFPHADGNAAKEFTRVVPFYRDIRGSLEACIAYAEKENLNVEFEMVLPCLFDRTYDIKYFADLKYAERRIELKQLDSDAIDWSQMRKSLKRKGAICRECRYDRICEGYWMEYVAARGFSEFKPAGSGTSS